MTIDIYAVINVSLITDDDFDQDDNSFRRSDKYRHDIAHEEVGVYSVNYYTNERSAKARKHYLFRRNISNTNDDLRFDFVRDTSLGGRAKRWQSGYRNRSRGDVQRSGW